jgi:hypothetical protein
MWSLRRCSLLCGESAHFDRTVFLRNLVAPGADDFKIQAADLNVLLRTAFITLKIALLAPMPSASKRKDDSRGEPGRINQLAEGLTTFL